jgi:predicted polyphosphate/ATP-dependent NAD kinase
MTHNPISVGIIANPSSGRDIRRLLARASVYPTSEKINDVLRLLAAIGPLGVAEAWMIPDRAGIAHAVAETSAAEREKRGHVLPIVRMLDMRAYDTVEDTLRAVELMLEHGVRAIAVLGGDGTHRAVARRCGQTPLATLSTGTNNAFPERREATTTGLALALFATGRVPAEVALRRNKILRVAHGERRELALVDVCVARQRFLGARAIWQPGDLSQLFVTFAEPSAIGLSSIAGLSLPTARHEPFGVQVVFGEGQRLLAPIAPGLLEQVAITSVVRLNPNEPVELPAGEGTIAFDGEREIEYTWGDRVMVELGLDGPLTIAVAPTMAYAAQAGLLRLPLSPAVGISLPRIIVLDSSGTGVRDA